MSVGLILNELLTNAIKYATKNRKEPSIRVRLAYCNETTEAALIVSDDGPGIKQQRDGSMGLKLVQTLASQISGSSLLQQTDDSTLIDGFLQKHDGGIIGQPASLPSREAAAYVDRQGGLPGTQLVHYPVAAHIRQAEIDDRSLQVDARNGVYCVSTLVLASDRESRVRKYLRQRHREQPVIFH